MLLHGIKMSSNIYSHGLQPFTCVACILAKTLTTTRGSIPVKLCATRGNVGGDMPRPSCAERLASNTRAIVKWSWWAATATSRFSSNCLQCWWTIHLKLCACISISLNNILYDALYLRQFLKLFSYNKEKQNFLY